MDPERLPDALATVYRAGRDTEPVGEVGPFIKEGYEQQYEGAYKDGDDDLIRRVFQDPLTALRWVDDNLQKRGLVLSHAADKVMIGALGGELCDAVKAWQKQKAQEAEDEVPF